MSASARSAQPPDIWRPVTSYPDTSCINFAWVVGALPGSTSFPAVLVGSSMEMNKNKNKNKIRLRNEVQKRSEDEESNVDLEVEPRVVLTPVKGHSRSSSTSSIETVETMRPGISGKNKQNKQVDVETEKAMLSQSSSRKERNLKSLFLKRQINLIKRLKYILEKWAAMETRLQNALVENRILKEKRKYVELSETLSCAQAAAMRKHVPRPPLGEQRKNVSPPKERYEVVLIKPEKEDKRNNEQIKDNIFKGLDNMRKKIKVRSVRQMRKQGLVVEVMD